MRMQPSLFSCTAGSASRPESKYWHLPKRDLPGQRSFWMFLPQRDSLALQNKSQLRSGKTWMLLDLKPVSQLPVTLMQLCWPRVDLLEPRSFLLGKKQTRWRRYLSPSWNLNLSSRRRSRHGGSKHLGHLAALPEKAMIARTGQTGYRLQALARGEYQHLFVPVEPPPDAILSERTELEHPVDLLEPLLFLLGRMLEQIVARAAERALAIAYVETSLVLDS